MHGRGANGAPGQRRRSRWHRRASLNVGAKPWLPSRQRGVSWALYVAPREVDPNINSAEEWCAWARGQNRERLEGRGTGPHNALLAITVKLKDLSG